ncbi:MAG: ferredoxin [Leptospiraceae bacterium]|nr:ferredoxin [Leptospiraceae bacterium]
MEVAGAHAHIAFYLTGRQFSDHLNGIDKLNLKPALFARFKNMTEVRYDYPVILTEENLGKSMVESLSSVIDKALLEVKTGIEGDRIKKNALQIEKEIRCLLTNGVKGNFSSLWKKAANSYLSQVDKAFQEKMEDFKASIKIDGEVVDCDEKFPELLIKHLWETAQKKKAELFSKNLERLIVKLSDILKSDFEKSEKGRSKEHLEKSIGGVHGDLFDFTVMSKFLSKTIPKEGFPESRKKRISDLLDVLKSQKFFSLERVESETRGNTYTFIFESCSDALETYLARYQKMIELARAIAIAELEIEGQYNPTKHDILFEDFGANGLDPTELSLFPDYLVCVNTHRFPASEYARLLEILSSELPIKVLLQTDDILEETKSNNGNFISGMGSKQLASMAMGLNDVYVLQSSNSNLYKFREQILDGLHFSGSSLFSIYSGASGKSNVSPYLLSAAAMESRAFPAFVYDPSHGSNWASRFNLQANSQIDLDWNIHSFQYEGASLLRKKEEIAFTYLDFISCDTRYARHFARVSESKWDDSLLAVDESLTREKKGFPDKIPFIYMVDNDNILQKVIVDERMLREARRSREMWRSLQELGGIHNSHAEILLAREKKAWEARMQVEADKQTEAVATVTSSSAVVEAEPERSRDEAYIDSPRCSTCNECVTLNNKMFAYDNNRQAYIADVNAGTYAQLVEAAENCQVSVIHPGKPRNPKEPGLEELLKRAEAFR